MMRVRLTLELVGSDGDPTPPWPGDEFHFAVELALWPARPRGRRSWGSGGEPPEPGGWELRQAQCRAIRASEDLALLPPDGAAARACSNWLLSTSETPAVRAAIEGALEHHRQRCCDKLNT